MFYDYVLVPSLLHYTFTKTIIFKDVQQQQQQQQKIAFNSASYSPKKIIEHDKISPVEDKEIKIIGTRPEISRTFSPIVINIEIPQTHHFIER